MIAKPQAAAIKIVAVYWTLLILGMVTYTSLRLDALTQLEPVWTGAIGGSMLGQLLAAKRYRTWLAMMLVLAVALLLLPQMPHELGGKRLWLSFLPAALCGYWSLGDRTSLAAFWFPAMIWMLSILDGTHANALPGREGLVLFAALTALFIVYLRVREERRVALWQTVAPEPIAAAKPAVIVQERTAVQLASGAWGLLVTGLGFGVTAWLAPLLWQPEVNAGGHSTARTLDVAYETATTNYVETRERHVEVARRRAAHFRPTYNSPSAYYVTGSYDGSYAGTSVGDGDSVAYVDREPPPKLPCCPIDDEIDTKHVRVKEFLALGRSDEQVERKPKFACRPCTYAERYPAPEQVAYGDTALDDGGDVGVGVVAGDGSGVGEGDVVVRDATLSDIAGGDVVGGDVVGGDVVGGGVVGGGVVGGGVVGGDVRGADIRGADVRGADIRGDVRGGGIGAANGANDPVHARGDVRGESAHRKMGSDPISTSANAVDSGNGARVDNIDAEMARRRAEIERRIAALRNGDARREDARSASDRLAVSVGTSHSATNTNSPSPNRTATNNAATSNAATNNAATNNAATNNTATNNAATNNAATNNAATNSAATNNAARNNAATNSAATNNAATNSASTNPASASINPATNPSSPATTPPTPSSTPAATTPATTGATTAKSDTDAVASRPANDSSPSFLHWIVLLTASLFATQLIALALRPIRRAIALRHLRRPYWHETVDQRISNSWQLVLVGLRDAGWRADSTESPRELARRVGIAGVERCATILDRARHGIRIDREDLDDMTSTASDAYRDARKQVRGVGRAASWLRWPLV